LIIDEFDVITFSFDLSNEKHAEGEGEGENLKTRIELASSTLLLRNMIEKIYNCRLFRTNKIVSIILLLNTRQQKSINDAVMMQLKV
jgi:hypothetical protein